MSQPPARIAKIRKGVRIGSVSSADAVRPIPASQSAESHPSILKRVSPEFEHPSLRDTPSPKGDLKAWIQAQQAVDVEATHISSSLEEWALMTGWHGVVDFFYAKTALSKFVWAAVVGLCGFLALNETISMLMDFTDGEKWTTSITYSSGEKDAVQWPNITVSNLNWLGQSSLNKSNLLDPYLVTYIVDADINAVDFYARFIDNTTISIDRLRKKTEAEFNQYLSENKVTRTQIITDLAQKCDETVLHCGKITAFDLALKTHSCCGSSRASRGKISSFNLDMSGIFGIRTAFDQPGYKNGIYFLLDSKAEDDYKNVRREEKPSSGFRVILYYGDEPDSTSASMMVSPGSHTVIAIAAQRHQIAKPSRSFMPWDTARPTCMLTTDNYTYQYVNGTDYTVDFCQEDCKTRYLVSKFNCTCQEIEMRTGDWFCQNSTAFSDCSAELNELEKPQMIAAKSTKKMNLTKCFAECMEPCNYDVVSTKISRAKFPAESKIESFTLYMNRALGNLYKASGVKHVSLLEIYFESNQMVIMERIRRISVNTLISNIGGSLGVWTGLSIISIVQALVYVFFGIKQIIEGIIWLNSRPEPVYIRPRRKWWHICTSADDTVVGMDRASNA